MTDSVTEKQLISEILAGDSEQYRYLVERYHKGLINHLANLLQDETLAEDIAQEAFIQAYNKLHLYNSDYAFSTWLYKIASNLAYRSIKQIKRTVDIADIEEILPDETMTTAEKLDIAQTKATVQEAIQTLEVNYQQVIALYYWDNLSYEQIAAVIDKPIGTVRTWLYRAKEQLRKELYGQIR
ncbi:MAG: RNA polymerase sigma factor [Candidatus Saccharimonadales bacterium]|jgi:RNA polymerase sigma-70 factor (ECF subfamily)